MGKETWTKEEIDKLKKMFFENTLNELQKAFPNHSIYGIRNKSLRLGLKKNRSEVAQEQRKYPVNLDLFDKYTEESCYWLGFISADGCIYYDEEHSRYGLAFTQHRKDKEHILSLYKLLGGSPPSITKDNKVNYRCISKKLAEQLISKGINPRKSLTNTYPKNIPEMYHSHFIRGYVDGDGTIRIGLTRQGKLKLSISIVGTKTFLERVKEIIFSKGFGMNVNLNRDRPEKELFVLNYQDRNKVIELGKWLYPKNCFALERKKNPIYEYAKVRGIEV